MMHHKFKLWMPIGHHTSTSSIKRCSCGVSYSEIPREAKLVPKGYVGEGRWQWNCVCGSTLMYKDYARFTENK